VVPVATWPAGDGSCPRRLRANPRLGWNGIALSPQVGCLRHPSLTSPSYAKPGNGLLLFFRIDNFDVALPRARALVSRLEDEPHVNPNTGTAEFSLRDPDGYYITISALNAA
jgi:catechol 2,3-dioxygenase-like lactoylglutathione lyase family enzyme